MGDGAAGGTDGPEPVMGGSGRTPTGGKGRRRSAVPTRLGPTATRPNPQMGQLAFKRIDSDTSNRRCCALQKDHRVVGAQSLSEMGNVDSPDWLAGIDNLPSVSGTLSPRPTRPKHRRRRYFGGTQERGLSHAKRVQCVVGSCCRHCALRGEDERWPLNRAAVFFIACGALGASAQAGVDVHQRLTVMNLANAGPPTTNSVQGWLATNGAVSIPYFDTLGGSRQLTSVVLDCSVRSHLTVRLDNPTADLLGVWQTFNVDAFFTSPFPSIEAWGHNLPNPLDVRPFASLETNLDANALGSSSFNGAGTAQFVGSGDFSMGISGVWRDYRATVFYANNQPVNGYPFPGSVAATSGHMDMDVTVHYYYNEVIVAVPIPSTVALSSIGLTWLMARRRPRCDR